MASDPKRYSEPQWSWPSRGGAMTEDEYHELERLNADRKYEYIAGLAYMMSGGSVGHDRITRNVDSLLDRHFFTGPCTVFGTNVQVLLGTKKSGKRHYVYPDVTISRDVVDRRQDNQLIESPRVVIEVLSPSTEARDRGAKFRAYQKCPTIQEIVLVDQFAPYVEIWQRDEENAETWHYRHYGPGETVELASIDVSIKMDEIYRGLDFAQEAQELEDEE